MDYVFHNTQLDHHQIKPPRKISLKCFNEFPFDGRR